MIYDSLKNIELYAAIHPAFPQLIVPIRSGSLAVLPSGKHEIGSHGIAAVVSEYTTAPQAERFIECHHACIDVQFLAEGRELVGILPAHLCSNSTPYDAGKDLQKLEGPLDFITLRTGCFLILFPHDGHMPGVSAGCQEKVKKICLKVPVAG